MFTQQRIFLAAVGSILFLAAVASPCSAQIIYVRDAAGYIVPIAQPGGTYPFGMSFQPQAVVSPDRRFVRINPGPLSVQMFDPAASIVTAVPGPPLGIFQGGFPQPAFLNQPRIILVGGAQQQLNGNPAGQFPLQRAAMFQANAFPRVQPVAFMPMQMFPQVNPWMANPMMMQPMMQPTMMNPMWQAQMWQPQMWQPPIAPMWQPQPGPWAQVRVNPVPGVAQPGMIPPLQPLPPLGMLAQPGMFGPLLMPPF